MVSTSAHISTHGALSGGLVVASRTKSARLTRGQVCEKVRAIHGSEADRTIVFVRNSSISSFTMLLHSFYCNTFDFHPAIE